MPMVSGKVHSFGRVVFWALIASSAALSVPVESGAARWIAHDPPRIVPWHQIGNIGLGMSRTRIDYLYGHGQTVGWADETWQVAGGQLQVLYHSGLATLISTTSPRYRTKDGLGVGSRIPLGSCHRVGKHCVYRWRGFVFTGSGWRYEVKTRATTTAVQLDTEQGVVTNVLLIRATR